MKPSLGGRCSLTGKDIISFVLLSSVGSNLSICEFWWGCWPWWGVCWRLAPIWVCLLPWLLFPSTHAPGTESSRSFLELGCSLHLSISRELHLMQIPLLNTRGLSWEPESTSMTSRTRHLLGVSTSNWVWCKKGLKHYPLIQAQIIILIWNQKTPHPIISMTKTKSHKGLISLLYWSWSWIICWVKKNEYLGKIPGNFQMEVKIGSKQLLFSCNWSKSHLSVILCLLHDPCSFH